MIIFLGITHIVLALSLYLLLYDFNIYILALVAIGAILPDIDHPFATLGKYNPLAPFMKHRGFMHTIVAASLISLLFRTLTLDSHFAIMFGYITHLLSDSLTPTGIMWKFPFDTKYYTLNKHLNAKAIEGIVFGMSMLYLFSVYKFNI